MVVRRALISSFAIVGLGSHSRWRRRRRWNSSSGCGKTPSSPASEDAPPVDTSKMSPEQAAKIGGGDEGPGWRADDDREDLREERGPGEGLVHAAEQCQHDLHPHGRDEHESVPSSPTSHARANGR